MNWTYDDLWRSLSGEAQTLLGDLAHDDGEEWRREEMRFHCNAARELRRHAFGVSLIDEDGSLTEHGRGALAAGPQPQTDPSTSAPTSAPEEPTNAD